MLVSVVKHVKSFIEFLWVIRNEFNHIEEQTRQITVKIQN
jgi:hypothetical protein